MENGEKFFFVGRSFYASEINDCKRNSYLRVYFEKSTGRKVGEETNSKTKYFSRGSRVGIALAR